MAGSGEERRVTGGVLRPVAFLVLKTSTGTHPFLTSNKLTREGMSLILQRLFNVIPRYKYVSNILY